MKFSLFVLTFLSFCDILRASKILFAFPSPSKSHLIVVQGLSTYLARKGHNVTVVSPFPLSEPIENHRDIVIPLKDDKFAKGWVEKPQGSILRMIPHTIRQFLEMAERIFEVPEFIEVMEEEKFDLVVIGVLMNDFLLGLGDHFKCPTMMLSTNAGWTPTNQLFGNPSSVATVPSLIAQQAVPMNFISRVENFIYIALEHAYAIFMNNLQREAYEKYFPFGRYVSYDEAVNNISMVLLNSHFTQGIVRPLLPAMVEVGGLQINPTPDPLPKVAEVFVELNSF